MDAPVIGRDAKALSDEWPQKVVKVMQVIKFQETRDSRLGAAGFKF